MTDQIIEQRDKTLVDAFLSGPQFAEFVLDNIIDGIYTIDESGIVQAINAKALQLFGYSEREVLGRHFMLLVPDHYHKRAMDNFIGIVKSGQTGHANFDQRILGRCKDGTMFSHQGIIVLLPNPEGQPLYLIVIRDINERQLLEEELARIKIGIDQTSDAIFMFGRPDNRIFYLNQAAHRLLNYDLDDLGTMTIANIAQNIDMRTIDKTLNSLQANGKDSITVNTELTDKSGSLVPVEAVLQSVRTDTGTEQIVVIVRDITDRKKIEDTNREQQEYLRAIIDNTVDGLVIINTRGLIESFNDAAAAIFGYTEDEIIGQHVTNLLAFTIKGDQNSYISHLLESGRTQIIDEARILPGKHKDGTVFDISLAMIEIKLPHHHAFVGFVRDISKQKAAEQQLIEARDNAERANAAKSQFMSRMSHELRTPLNSILGFAQILEMEDLPKQSLEDVDYILKAGQHLLELVNEVLDIARIESGTMTMSLEPVDIGELLYRNLQLTGPQAEAKQLSLNNQDLIKDWQVFVLADPKNLRLVVSNLISNAIKYNSNGGAIDISYANADDGFIRLSIKDSGRGIPADKHAFIFEPFARLDSTEKIEGTGIGLAHCKALISNMNGRIGVTSEFGKGSEFWLELPQVKKP